jgi:hypothetical protein
VSGETAAGGRDWVTVRPFVIGIAACGLLALYNESRGLDLWRNYAVTGMMLGSTVTWIMWRTDVRVPAYIQWMILVGLFTHYIGGSLAAVDGFRMGLLGTHGVNGAYHTYEWWDNLTHGLGIAAVAMGTCYLVELYQVRRGLGWTAWQVAVVGILASLAIGVGVELYEFIGKTAFQTIDQGGYANTVADLQFNIVGGVAGGTFAVTVNRMRFWEAIRRRFPPPERPAERRIPPGMWGILGFIALPALATLYIAARGIGHSVPLEDDVRMYDRALLMLVRSALLACLLGPAAMLAARQRARGPRPEAPTRSAP